MIPHRSNADTPRVTPPPVVAPPVVADTKCITSPEGHENGQGPATTNVADVDASSPDTFFQKVLSPRPLTVAALLVVTTCIVSLTFQQQLRSSTPAFTPSSGFTQRRTDPLVANTLPTNLQITTQDSGSSLKQSAEKPIETGQLAKNSTSTELVRRPLQSTLPMRNELLETTSWEPDPRESTEALTATKPAAWEAPQPDPLHAPNVKLTTADSDKQLPQETDHIVANTSPDQLLTAPANSLVSTFSTDTSFTDTSFTAGQPFDWMSSVIAGAPETLREHQPDQIACIPERLPPLQNPGVCANSGVRAQGQRNTTLPNYETQLSWIDQPDEAFERAKEEDKLVFMIHISGNFKIPGFT